MGNRRSKAIRTNGVQENQKYDLSKWKYSELRHTINTSCDIELIEACRQEAIRINGVQENQIYDLSKWKFPELRDIGNTSCDIELLEACRHEFYRRLNVYYAWKAKCGIGTTMEENERAPKSIMESAARTLEVHQKTDILGSSQRFFRIPFVRPSTILASSGQDNNKRGWWFAHFDGQYVARQMELHPDEQLILLVAGTDDMQMCEISLEETGLTRKRGAEILESEFNKEWQRHGGKTYITASERNK